MPAVAFTVPLVPGTTDAGRAAMVACAEGDRREDHVRSRRRLRITRESVWYQRTPEGDLAVVSLEAHDLGRASEGCGRSDEPFDRWFRDGVRDAHGIDRAQGSPPPERVLAFRAWAPGLRRGPRRPRRNPRSGAPRAMTPPSRQGGGGARGSGRIPSR